MKDNETGNLKGTKLFSLEELEEKISDDSRYVDRVKIGQGGQATVYKVFDQKLKVHRAMKILNHEFSEDREFVKDFIREIRLTAELNSPNIVKVYDADYVDNELFMIMDYIDGNTASHSGKLPKSMAVAIALKAASALEYAHSREIDVDGIRRKGIIHRDIKPDNLMICQSGEVMVMDFGLSKPITKKVSSSTSNIFGSIAYMAPELFDKEISAQSDIYSLGITLYELLSELTGFEGMSPSQIFKFKSTQEYVTLLQDDFIDPELKKIIEKATQKSTSKRYSTIGEMIKDLEEYLHSHYIIENELTKVIGAYTNFKILPPEKARVVTKPPKKKKNVGAIITIILILSALVFGVMKRNEIVGLFKKDPIEKPVKTVQAEPVKPVQAKPVKPVKQIEKKKETSKPVAKATKYYIVINKDKKVAAKIHINGKVYDIKANEKQKKIALPSKDTYSLKITSSGIDDFNKDVSISKKENSVTYTIPEYKIDFGFPREAEKFQITINSKEIGNLKHLSNGIYITNKSGKYLVKLEDPKGKYLDIEKTVTLNKANTAIPFQVTLNKKQVCSVTIKNPNNIQGKISISGAEPIPFSGEFKRTFDSNEMQYFVITAAGYKIVKDFIADFQRKDKWVFTYKPKPLPPEEKPKEVIDIPAEVIQESETELYITKINNPDSVPGEISINGQEPVELGPSFQEKYADNELRSYTITAPGYEDVSFTANFALQSEFEFVYSPLPLIMTLTITDTPAGGTVSINGSQSAETQSSQTIINIENILLDSSNDIIIKVEGYLDWKSKFVMSSISETISYMGVKLEGKITIIPELESSLASQTKLYVDGKSVPFTQKLTDLTFEKHTLDIIFRIGDYEDKLSEVFNLTSASNSQTWSLNIDLVKIESTEPETELEIDGTSVGVSPITIPFINKNLVTIYAITDKYDRKQESICPKDYAAKTYKFNFPRDEKAEEAYYEALEHIEDFEETGNTSLLTKAKLKLDEALSLYNGYPEALCLYFKFLAIQTKLGYDSDDSSKLDKYFEIARTKYDENKSTFDDDSIHGWVLGYFLTCNYYKFILISDPNAKKYHLKDVLGSYNEKYLALRKKIKTDGIQDNLEKDRLDCNWARLCHAMWTIEKTEGAEPESIEIALKRAKKAWNSNPFNDLIDPANPTQPFKNPFKQIKNQHYRELINN